MRPRSFACLVALAVVAPATAARAATVHVTSSAQNGVSTVVVTGTAGGDDLTLRAGPRNSVIGPLDVTVSDPGAPVAPDGAGCTQAGPHAVHCSGPNVAHA